MQMGVNAIMFVYSFKEAENTSSPLHTLHG